MKMMFSFCWHSWGHWKDWPVFSDKGFHYVTGKRRLCRKCGKSQFKELC